MFYVLSQMRLRLRKILFSLTFIGTLILIATNRGSNNTGQQKMSDQDKHIQKLEDILKRSEDLSEKEEKIVKAKLEKRSRRSEKQESLRELQKQVDLGLEKDLCYPHKDFVTVGDDGRLGNQLSGYASLVGFAECVQMKMVISEVGL